MKIVETTVVTGEGFKTGSPRIVVGNKSDVRSWYENTQGMSQADIDKAMALLKSGRPVRRNSTITSTPFGLVKESVVVSE